MASPAIPDEPLWEVWVGPQGAVQVHHRSRCVGEWCVIHNPMPGPWSQWPLWWRSDRGIMERTCPCGMGHPAVEQLLFWERVGQGYKAIHGCCGVCPCAPVNGRRSVAIESPSGDIEVVVDGQVIEVIAPSRNRKDESEWKMINE